MSAQIDDELAARIQEFTTWAVIKGYGVVGMFIGPKGSNEVKVFCTTPPGNNEQEFLKKMVDTMYHAVHKGSSKGQLTMTLGNN